MRKSLTLSAMGISATDSLFMFVPKLGLVFLLLLPLVVHAQNWGTGGNTGSAALWLGTNNAFPLTLKTNNTERFSISPAGIYRFNSLGGTGTGLLLLNSDGTAARLNFSGSAAQVLNGAGSFVGINSLTGWAVPATGITATTNKVGIGVTSPLNALEVAGNGLFSGTVYAQRFIVGDASTVQGRLTFSNNMYLDGYDPIAGTRNEVYTISAPLYLQSAYLNDYNTIINHNNSGKVGIGISNPTAKFHVAGSARFDGAVRMDSLQLGNDVMMKSGTASGMGLFTVGPVASTLVAFFPPVCIPMGAAKTIQSVKGIYAAYSDHGSVNIGHNGSAFIQSNGEGAAGTLRINDYCGNNISMCSGTGGGNVGIGTASPASKFQVKTGAFGISIGSAQAAGLNYGTAYIGFNATRVDENSWSTATDSAHNGGVVMYGNVIGDFFLANVPNTGAAVQTGISDSAVLSHTRLYIASTGETGIGTRCIPAGYKMAIDGRLMCEGVRVKYSDSTGCWPDYVFDARYDQMSITQLEEFVRTNRHLPGVPSEREVMADGVDLVEMNRALLRSTEENSLYIIALKRENEEMKKRMEELKRLIEEKR